LTVVVHSDIINPRETAFSGDVVGGVYVFTLDDTAEDASGHGEVK
jgi:acyl-CoA hydrolase